jgi:hypothetical protein
MVYTTNSWKKLEKHKAFMHKIKFSNSNIKCFKIGTVDFSLIYVCMYVFTNSLHKKYVRSETFNVYVNRRFKSSSCLHLWRLNAATWWYRLLVGILKLLINPEVHKKHGFLNTQSDHQLLNKSCNTDIVRPLKPKWSVDF